MKTKFLAIVILICCNTFLHANTSDSLRIVKLEEQVLQLQNTNQNNTQTIGIIGFVILAIFAGLIKWSIDRGMKNIETSFKAKVEEQLLAVLNEKKATVNKTFEVVDYNRSLLNNKCLGLWGEADASIVRSVLKRMDYNMENLIDLNLTGFEEQKFDVLLINNISGKVNSDKMLEIVKGLPQKTLVFYFNNTRAFFPIGKLKLEDQDKVNFATNPSQIYGNLMNTLAYQDKY